MNAYYFFTTIYGLLHPYKIIPNRLLSPIRYIVRKLGNKYIPLYFNKIGNINCDKTADVIVSLTSFPARINDVWKVIMCLKSQSVEPKLIILWLSKKQFPGEEDIPQKLKDLCDSQFEIRLVDDDIRSYKKYYYAMKMYPDDYIITVDDDIFYHRDCIKTLLDTSKMFPRCIIANDTTQLEYDGDVLKPYRNWNGRNKKLESRNLVQIGVGGVLYPPHSLNKLAFDKTLFMNLAPLADDLWLNSTARINRTPIVKSKKIFTVLPVEIDAPSLSSINGGQGKNDEQIENIRHYFKKELGVDPYNSDYIIEY